MNESVTQLLLFYHRFLFFHVEEDEIRLMFWRRRMEYFL